MMYAGPRRKYLELHETRALQGGCSKITERHTVEAFTLPRTKVFQRALLPHAAMRHGVGLFAAGPALSQFVKRASIQGCPWV